MSGPTARGGNGGQQYTIEKSHCVVRTPRPLDRRESWGQAFQRKQMKANRQTLQHKDKCQLRTRPTNNQLLYKAYFRWHHYPVRILDSDIRLLSETDACASVTAAFLQVLAGLQDAETMRTCQARNIFKILSKDTRHTKVVDLSSATHRVSDELRRHCLSDSAGNQYSTNLDRNRYGTDDQYMFTVIRHNLRMLDLCACLVDVEVLDQKSNDSVLVSAGIDACSCHKDGQDIGEFNSQALRTAGARSGSERFDALIAAATGETEGNGHFYPPGSPPPRSRSLSLSGQRSRHVHQSQCEVDSLQHALNAFKAEDEVAMGLHHMSESRDSSKRVKRSFSSLHPSRFFGSGLSDMQWGLPEKVEDNVRPDPQPEANQEAQQGAHEVMAAAGKRGREQEADEPWQQVRFVGKQSSVSRVSNRVTPAEFKRLMAEVRDLGNESRHLKDEIVEVRREVACCTTRRVEMEEEQKRWRKVESEVESLRAEMRRLVAERAIADERAKDDLTASREVISLLLRRLNILLANQGQSLAGREVLKQMRSQTGSSDTLSGSSVQANGPHLQAAASQQVTIPEHVFSQEQMQPQGQGHTQQDAHSLVAMFSPLNQNIMFSLAGQSASSAVLALGGNVGQALLPVPQIPALQTTSPSDILPHCVNNQLSARSGMEASIAMGAAGRALDSRMLGAHSSQLAVTPTGVKVEIPKAVPQGLVLGELEKLAAQVGGHGLPQGM